MRYYFLLLFYLTSIINELRSREYRVEIDPTMANIVMSTLILEGLGRSLDPDLNLIECALPFVMGRGKV